jgi:hypothetical protein
MPGGSGFSQQQEDEQLILDPEFHIAVACQITEGIKKWLSACKKDHPNFRGKSFAPVTGFAGDVCKYSLISFLLNQKFSELIVITIRIIFLAVSFIGSLSEA